MSAFLVLLLAAAWTIDPSATWSAHGAKGGPRIQKLADGGWQFSFSKGTAPEAGFVQLPVDGERLTAAGMRAFQVDGRARGARLDFVLVYADSVARLPLQVGRPIDVPRTERRIRFVRLESPPGGLPQSADVEVKTLRALVDDGAAGAAATRALRSESHSPAHFASEGTVPFGVFILGGNRSLFEDYAMSGANATVEYGPVHWPLAVAMDHVDRAQAAGVRVALGVTSDRGGEVIDEGKRLAPALAHPGALAAYSLDEPDGGSARGLSTAACSPESLAKLHRHLREVAPAPVLITCMDSFGLAKFGASADFLSTDPYLPAYGPTRPFTEIFAAAASVVEIAARAHGTPFIVLQLEDPQWPAPEQQQTRESLRAQTFASLAAGVRGLLYYEGVAPLRRARQGANADGRWHAFLDLAGEVATFAPAASRWTAIAGQPELTPAIGDVRAQAFADGDDTWILLVNLGRVAVGASLGGQVLAGASALEEPATGWRAELRAGSWSGKLEPLEAHAARVVHDGDAGKTPHVRVVGAHPVGEIGVDRVIAGCALDPAPRGDVRIAIDGEDLTGDLTGEARMRRGAAMIVRARATELSVGEHRVAVSWTEGGAPRESTWSFTVAERALRGRLPITEQFDGAGLDANRWAVVEPVIWDFHGSEAMPARGTAKVEKGELRIRSTGGPFGVVLRGVEAPERFKMEWTVRMPRAGTIVVNRNELLRRVPVPAGEHRIVMRETQASLAITVDAKEVVRFEPPIDHQGGAIGLGVAAGGEAWIDDVRLEIDP